MWPEIEGELSLQPFERFGVVRVRSRRHGDRIVVDRVGDEPFVGGRAVRMMRGASQPSVGDIHHRVGQRQGDALAVRFIGLGVLVRPPYRRTHALVRGDDPRPAQTVAGPGEPALPGRVGRDPGLAVVVHGDGPPFPGSLRRAQRCEERVAVAAESNQPSILDHAVHFERSHQVDLHFAGRFEHPVGDAVVPPDAAVAGIDCNVKIVERDIPPRSCRRRERSAQRVGVTVDPRYRGRAPDRIAPGLQALRVGRRDWPAGHLGAEGDRWNNASMR